MTGKRRRTLGVNNARNETQHHGRKRRRLCKPFFYSTLAAAMRGTPELLAGLLRYAGSVVSRCAHRPQRRLCLCRYRQHWRCLVAARRTASRKGAARWRDGHLRLLWAEGGGWACAYIWRHVESGGGSMLPGDISRRRRGRKFWPPSGLGVRQALCNSVAVPTQRGIAPPGYRYPCRGGHGDRNRE